MHTIDKKINWEVISLTRFLLALVVMIGHLQAYTSVGWLKYYTYLGSFEAILGFLLISGLSIGKSIARDRTNYFKRRLQRIYPVYVASILFQILAVGVSFDAQSLIFLLLNLLFLNQLFTDTSFVGPAWTLSAEVWFYSLAPLFLSLRKKTFHTLIYVSFFCYLFYSCGRTLFHWSYYSGTKYGINLILLAFVWMAGFGLAIFPKSRKEGTLLIAILFGGHLALTMGIQTMAQIKKHHIGEIFSDDLLPLFANACCLLLAYVAVVYNHRVPTFKPLVSKTLSLLGNISYPMYLTHATAFQLLSKAGVKEKYSLIFSALVVAFFIYFVFDFYSKKRQAKQLMPSEVGTAKVQLIAKRTQDSHSFGEAEVTE